MDKFFGIMVMAIILEGFIAYFKMFFDSDRKVQWQCLMAIAVGVFMGIAYNLDLLAAFGISTALPYVGCALTGILISRGSNYIADLVKIITNLNQGFKKES